MEQLRPPIKEAVPQTAAILFVVLILTRFGGLFTLPPSGISAFWPANALLLSGALLMPRTSAHIPLMLALPTYYLAELWLGYPPDHAAIYSFANVAEVSVFLWLIRNAQNGSLAFDDIKKLLTFFTIAFPVSLVGGAIGAITTLWTGGHFGTVLMRWSLADFFGYCLFLPLILTWSMWPQIFSQRRPYKIVEFAALLTALLLIAVISFDAVGIDVPSGTQFLSIPILLWAALRFGPPGGAVSMVLLACIAFFSATHGIGPFSGGEPEENVKSLQIFFASVIISVMTIASLNAERKRAEKHMAELNAVLEQRVEQRTRELAESEARFRTIYETAPVSIWQEDWTEIIKAIESLRAEGVSDFEVYFREHPEFVTHALNAVKIQDVNQWTLGIFEAQNKEDMFASLETVFATPDTLPGFIKELVALAHGQTVYRTEMRLNTVKGNQIDSLLSMSFPATGSTSSNVLVSLIDITDRKQAEKLLQESRRSLEEERYLLHTLVDSIPDAIYFKDVESRFVRINKALSRRFGLSDPAEAVGKTDFDFFTEKHALPAFEDEQAIIRSGQALLNKEEMETWPDGQTGWVLTTKMPLHDQDGNIIGTFGISSDITARKRAEENVQKLNEELRQRAEELETANKDLNTFCYSVSHDLRAPLRHIDGFIGLLQKRISPTLDEQSTHYMKTITDATKRMGMLIDDLLALSRTGRQALSMTKVDLQEMAQTVVHGFEQETRKRTIRWNIHDLPVISADNTLMHSVLENLVSNAIKFTRPRAVGEIEIGSYKQEEESVIFIRDNGVGFDMKYVDKLFGVFLRLHKSDEFEGSGIGLANVHRIISRHGGKIWAESQIDKGATFYFSLPSVSQRKIHEYK